MRVGIVWVVFWSVMVLFAVQNVARQKKALMITFAGAVLMFADRLMFLSVFLIKTFQFQILSRFLFVSV